MIKPVGNSQELIGRLSALLDAANGKSVSEQLTEIGHQLILIADGLKVEGSANIRQEIDTPTVIPTVEKTQAIKTESPVGVEGLTNKQKQVFEILKNNGTKITSLDDIAQALWPDGKGSSDAGIRFYIQAIKKQLGQDAVINKRGYGYRLADKFLDGGEDKAEDTNGGSGEGVNTYFDRANTKKVFCQYANCPKPRRRKWKAQMVRSPNEDYKDIYFCSNACKTAFELANKTRLDLDHAFSDEEMELPEVEDKGEFDKSI